MSLGTSSKDTECVQGRRAGNEAIGGNTTLALATSKDTVVSSRDWCVVCTLAHLFRYMYAYVLQREDSHRMLPDVSVPMAASSQSYAATATALPADEEEQYCQPSPRGLNGAMTSILNTR